MSYYTIAEFQDDLAKSETFVRCIRRVGDSLRLELDVRSKKIGLNAEILYVGSTHPDRLTSVVDPKAPDDRYQCDFDVGVITDGELELEEKVRIVEGLLPNGQTFRTNGRVERRTTIQKFPINMAVVSEDEASKLLPILYARGNFNLTEAQKRDIRALRLFAMRNAMYGGFTQGFKGITLERLVVETDSFEDALSWLHLHSQYKQSDPNYDVVLPNPINRTNLLKRVQQRMWGVVARSTRKYLEEKLIRAEPYTFQSWEEDNEDWYNFTVITTRLHDPDTCFRITEKYVYRALKTVARRFQLDLSNVTYYIFVQPHAKKIQVYVTLDIKDKKIQDNVYQEFRRRWDYSTKHDFKELM